MELVGPCCKCGISVYCKDGFLDGVSENGRLYCTDCYSDQGSETETSEKHDHKSE